MRKFLLALAASAAFAGPAFAQTAAPTGGVTGTTGANALALERSFDPLYGASIFGGRSQGQFGSLQADVANPSSGYSPYGQVVLQDGLWNGGESWTAH
jgi:hypothetical protein